MNYFRLPPENLQKIFMYLRFRDVKNCSLVCKEWEAVANDTIELKWKKYCKDTFWQVYESAHFKSQLSWQELYESLKLWSQLKSCQLYLHYSELLEPDGYIPLDSTEPKKMQVIKDGVIGYPLYMSNEEATHRDGRFGYCNSIGYYDPETLQMIDLVHYNFTFDMYEENEHFIVLRTTNLELRVVTKMNKAMHNLGKMSQDFSKFYLVGNKIFFIAADSKIWLCQLIYENDDATIKSTIFSDYDLFPALNTIAAFAYIDDNHVNLLTCRGVIYSVIDRKLQKLCQVKKKMDNSYEVVNLLKQHGFDWSSPEVYRWICNKDIISGDWVAITHLKNAVVHSHDRVVFIGTSRRSLHIYYNPYIWGELKLFNRRPTVKIDLNKHIPYDDQNEHGGMISHQRRILQIDCIEIPNGHRIIMLYCQRLVSIELRHEPLKRPGEPECVPAKPRLPPENLVANDTIELKWKKFCKGIFGQVYESAHFKSQLSWQELYKSLRLWSLLKSCQLYLHYSELLEPDGYIPLDSTEPKKMQVIKDGVIGYPLYMSNEEATHRDGRFGYCNSIGYYDPETLLMIDSVHYNFTFDMYEENEHFIVLRTTNLELRVVTKMNKAMHNLGKMSQYFSKFYLVGNKIFFVAPDSKIWLCQLIYENDDATIKSTIFSDYDLFPALNTIAAFAYIDDNHVNLLTCRGVIYSVIDRKLQKLCQVKKKMDNRNEVVNLLKQHGFDWSSPEVYRWICNNDIISGAITHLKNAVVHSHARVVFIGTSRRSLHIYYKPYIQGQLKLFNRRPTVKIDLNKHIPYDDQNEHSRMISHQRRILQIDCIEIPNGHRIIMLYCQRLVAIELRHEPLKRPGEPECVPGEPECVPEKPRCNSYRRLIP